MKTLLFHKIVIERSQNSYLEIVMYAELFCF